MRAFESWIDRQLRRRGIDDERVLAAMAAVPRELFVLPRERSSAYRDAALEIGFGQTISQPYVVAFICQSLALTGVEHVLDVGTGSGYQAAVLAELAGSVVSIERIPALSERARASLRDAGYGDRVELRVGDGAGGVPDRSPYDGIAVAAAAPAVPAALLEQLRDGGRLAIPVGDADDQLLHVFERVSGGVRRLESRPVRFVPLITGS